MDGPTVALIVGLVSASTTSLGWLVLHYLTRKRDFEAREYSARREEEGRQKAREQTDRTKRLELRLRYYERQIQEFYAPLYSNIQLIFNVWRIGQDFEKKLLQKDNDMPLTEAQAKIGTALGSNFFAPLHSEIRELLKAKLFLLEEVDLPQSYVDYLKHSVGEDVQRRLLEESGINTASVQGEKWPTAFETDVKRGLDKAMKNYDDLIKELAAIS